MFKVCYFSRKIEYLIDNLYGNSIVMQYNMFKMYTVKITNESSYAKALSSSQCNAMQKKKVKNSKKTV